MYAVKIYDGEPASIKIIGNTNVDYNFNALCLKYGRDNVFTLPCGSCPACRIMYKSDWSTRCMCESTYYEDNWFLTLTYDDFHLGENYLTRSDIKRFIKDLRNLGYKFRYFGCGEYGSNTKRKHWHIILFGLHLTDLEPYKFKENLLQSKTLNKVWNKGYITIGRVTPESCAYVAGYVNKKVDDNEKEKKGFVFMSTHPGIGSNFLLDNYFNIYKYDHIQLNNGYCASVPRYFDKLLKVVDKPLFDVVKKARALKASDMHYQELFKAGVTNIEELYSNNLVNVNNKVRSIKRGL